MIDAIYFDGQSARRHAVTLMIHKRVLAISGDGIRRSNRLSGMHVSERMEHAPRILRFPDGAFVEVQHATLEKLLGKNGYRESRVVRWQQNWPRSLFALIAVLMTLAAGYQWGLPWAADRIAQHLPDFLEKKIGDAGLRMIDGRYMHPSKLDAAEQGRMRKLFSGLVQPRGEKSAYRLEFRDSAIGPNAFALPNGVIVMTDQLVNLAHDDQAILAVLGHELGHLQRRHVLRRLLQAFGSGVVIHLLVGDVSTVLASAPTFLIDQKYSRDFEREADQYAIDMMRYNRIPLSPMASLFERMMERRHGDPDKKGEAKVDGPDEEQEEDAQNDEKPPPPSTKTKPRKGVPPDYLSSHPSDSERIARLRAADVGW